MEMPQSPQTMKIIFHGAAPSGFFHTDTFTTRSADEPGEYNKPKVVVVKLTDQDYVGREVKTSVSYKTLENWYSECKAVIH